MERTSAMDSLAESFRYGSSMFDSPVDRHTITCHSYLFGFPIAQSLSPVLHSSLFSQVQVPWTFDLVESMDQADITPKLRDPSCIGCAVTMPHKITFMSEVDCVTEEGRMIGALNTIFKRRDGNGHTKCIGTNTDCVGIREAFTRNHPNIFARSSGRPALIIGGGGTCRSAVYSLWKWMGSSDIYIVGRLHEEVSSVIASFRAIPEFDSRLIHVETVEQARSLSPPALIVSAVPDAEPKTPGEVQARTVVTVFLENEVKGILLEMCYHPHPITAIHKLAGQHGWEIISGVEAMIYQGVAQQVLWSELPIQHFNVNNAARIVRKAMNLSLNPSMA